MTTASRSAASFVPLRSITRVGETECVVRGTAVWPIADVLDLDEQAPAAEDEAGRLDATLLTDLLESRMIASPRPRRRQRAVSSRAVFLSATDG